MALSIKEIQDYVYENKSLVLATVCPGGRPHVRHIGGYTIDGKDIYFNTTKAGTFSNTAVVKSGKTDDVASACEVNVVKPEIKVEKVCLTPSVVLGNQARFEIIVNNTGKVDRFLLFVLVQILGIEDLSES